MKMFAEKYVPIIMGFFGMLFAIALAVTITLNCRALYVHDMQKFELSEYTGYSEEEILENYDVLIEYNSLFGPDKLEFPTLPMSEPGEIHFVEVKNIFVGLQIAGIISFIVFDGYLVINRKKHRNLAKMALQSASVMNVAIPAVVAAFIAMNWEKAFVTFHEIFFNNDYWIFDWRTDPIILLLPDEYFMHCAIMIIVIVIAFSAIYAAAGWMLKKKIEK